MSELHLEGSLDLAGDLMLGGKVFANGKEVLVLPSDASHSVTIKAKKVMVAGAKCSPPPGIVQENMSQIKISGKSVSMVGDQMQLADGSTVALTNSGQ